MKRTFWMFAACLLTIGMMSGCGELETADKNPPPKPATGAPQAPGAAAAANADGSGGDAAADPRQADPSAEPAAPEVGKMAPEIVGKDLDGEMFKLSDYRGKVVMLDFWGDW